MTAALCGCLRNLRHCEADLARAARRAARNPTPRAIAEVAKAKAELENQRARDCAH